jgi:hypothetical protein
MRWQCPPALFILGHASLTHLPGGETTPALLLSSVRADTVSIECFRSCKNLLAAGAL